MEHDTLPNVKISSSIPSELAYLLLSTMLSTAPGLTHITFRFALIDRISLPQSRLADIFVMVDTMEDNGLSGKMITVRFKWKPPVLIVSSYFPALPPSPSSSCPSPSCMS